jgi:hypothetical protein
MVTLYFKQKIISPCTFLINSGRPVVAKIAAGSPTRIIFEYLLLSPLFAIKALF